MTPQQIDSQIKVFNEFGYTSLVSALQVFQQFRNYTNDQDFEAYFFYKLANPLSNQKLSQNQQLWSSLILSLQLGQVPNPAYYTASTNILELKIYAFDNGVRFLQDETQRLIQTLPLIPNILFDSIFSDHPQLTTVIKFLNDKSIIESITKAMLKQFGNKKQLAIRAKDFEDIKNLQNYNQIKNTFSREITHLFLINYPQFFRTLKGINDGEYNEWIICDLETSLIYFKAQLSINSEKIKEHLQGYFKQINNYVQRNYQVKTNQWEERDEMVEYQQEITDDEQDTFQLQYDDEQYELKPVEPKSLLEFEVEPDQKQSVNQAKTLFSEEKKQQKQKEIEEYKIQLQQWEQRQELKKQSKLDQQAKPKVKKTKTVTRRRPHADEQLPQYKLLEKLKSCSTLIQNNFFSTLLNLALTDDKSLHAVYEVFLTWKFINPPKEQLQPDPQVIARLVEEGFKEPFDTKFFKIQEPRYKEYKAAVLDDMKSIKDMITQNEFIAMIRYRDVFQLILNNLLQLSHFFVEKPELKNYKLLQKNITAIPLQQDTNFIQEIKYFYENKYQNKYFENALPHNITDKWIQIFHFIDFHQDLYQQFVKFNQQYIKNIREWQKVYPKNEKQEQIQINCYSIFNYKVKLSNNQVNLLFLPIY